jgi:hypothetical protein
MPFARYNGEAEKALLAAGFPGVSGAVPEQVIRADDLVCSKVDIVVSGTGQRGGPAFENRDIRAMVELLQPQKAAIQLESLEKSYFQLPNSLAGGSLIWDGFYVVAIGKVNFCVGK